MDISMTRVVQAVEVMRAFEGRDVVSLDERELVVAQEAAARLLRLVEVPVALLASEVSRRSDRTRGGGLARREGHRNATRMVAKATGGSAGQAHALIQSGGLLAAAGTGVPGGRGGDEAGREAGADTATADGARSAGTAAHPVGTYPALAAAFTRGDISAAKADLVKRALDDVGGGDEGLEGRLVGRAVRLSLEDLRKACVQLVAWWDVRRQELREVRMRSERFLALSEQPDGMVAVSGRLDPASAAPVIAWLDAQVRAGFQARRDAGLGPAEPGEAGRLRIDALVDLARHGMRCDQPGSGVSTTVVVRIGLEELRSGAGIGSCDAVTAPLSAGQVRAMAVDAGYLPIVLGGGSAPLEVGRAKRFFTGAQRLALAERDGGCAFCHAPVAWCDAHHVTHWSAGGLSDLANGVLLCTRCHHRIHDDGWTVRVTPTEVWFTPPPTIDPDQLPRRGGKAALEISIGSHATPPR